MAAVKFVDYIGRVVGNASEDSDAIEEGSEEVSRPVTNYNEWQDDFNEFLDNNTRKTEGKFRPLEMPTHEQLLASTKTLVPEQKLVLQKVLDYGTLVRIP